MDSSKNFLFYEDIFCVLAQSLPYANIFELPTS